MNKQIGINLNFNADTKLAEQNIANLKTSLSAIANTPVPIGTKLTNEMQIAVNSAKSLQQHLSAAMNVNTGNLDLNKLNLSLQQAGQSLSSLTSGLLNAGIQGEQAFLNVQRAISTAGVQINKAQGMLGSFLVTLKNTAKWQLSSTLLHGFINGLRSSVEYAKDLDKSLNNIRIVTQYSSEKMAQFAKEANKAAKELNTTTVKYTDASLIFYQQGLDDEEVKKRAETTIKLANVSRQSAETTSEQLTAIWNNFYDGSKALEYYADVLTALGAATASSTKEIAGGLEKFAAVGETIGLSYEYAAAALATITSNTRQSEDVVGTALKTIFARIQGLKLGETLEDGTTLNKYSEALYAIGVDILDVNDNLKDMDTILNETAAKWQTLARDEQAALAQSVAGIRQYTQFIALMDNWNDGTRDSMVANLETAYGSEGNLQKQADIYAESWESASANVKASLEDLYNNLIPTDGLIELTNGLGNIISVISDIVEGFGGFSQILLLITSIILNKMGPAIIQNLNIGYMKVQNFAATLEDRVANGMIRIVETFSKFGAVSNNSVSQVSSQLNKIADSSQKASQHIDYFNKNLKSGATSAIIDQQISLQKAANSTIIMSDAFKNQIADLSQINNLQSLINNHSKNLTASTKAQLSEYQQQLLLLADKKYKEQEILDTIKLQQEALLFQNNFDYTSPRYSENYNASGQIQSTQIEASAISSKAMADEWIKIYQSIFDSNLALSETSDKVVFVSQGENGIAQAASNSLAIYKGIQETNAKINNILKNTDITLKSKKAKLHQIINEAEREGRITANQAKNYRSQVKSLNDSKKSAEGLRRSMQNLSNGAERFAVSLGNSPGTLKDMNNLVNQGVDAENKRAVAAEAYKNKLSEMKSLLLQGLKNFSTGFGATFQQITQSATTAAMGISSVVNMFDTLADKDASWTSKLTATTMGLSMGFSALMSTTNLLSTALAGYNAKKEFSNLLDIKSSTILLTKNKEALKEILMKKYGKTETEAAALAETYYTVTKEKGAKAGLKAILVNMGLNASLLPILLVLGAIVAIGFIFSSIMGDIQKNSPEENFKRAAQTAEDLNNALKTATEQAEKFKEAVTNYDEAIEGLRGLQKGTEEYTNKLKEANEQAEALINTYGLWDDYSIDINTGLYEIDKEALDRVAKEIDGKVIQAKQNAAAGQIMLESANLRQTRAKIQHDSYWNNTWGNFWQGSWIGLNEDAYLTESEVSEIITGMAKSKKLFGSNMSDEDFIKALKDIPDISDTIKQNEEGLIDFKSQIIEASDQLKDFGDSISRTASMIIKEEVKYQYSDEIESSFGQEYKEGTDEIVSQIISNQIQENTIYKEDLANQLSQIDVKDSEASTRQLLNITSEKYGGALSNEQLTREYALMMGYTEDQIANMIYTEDESYHGTLRSVDGKEVVIDNILHDDMIRALLVDQVTKTTKDFYMKQEEENSKKTIEALGQVTEAANGYIDGMGDAIISGIAKGKTEDGTYAFDFSDVYAEISSQDMVDALTSSDLSPADLLATIGITQDQLRQFGIDSAQEFQNSFVEAMEGWTVDKHEKAMWAKANMLLETGAKSYELDIEVLQAQAKMLEQNIPILQNNAKAAAKMAITNQRLNKGINELTESWDEWYDTLLSDDENSQEYAKAMVGVEKALKNILNLSEEDTIPLGLLQERDILNLINEAANGSVDAVTKLYLEFQKAKVESLTLSEDVKNNLINMFADAGETVVNDTQIEERFNSIKNNFINSIDDMQSALNSLNPGEALSDEKAIEFANALNAYAEMTGMTVEDMELMLHNMDLSADISTKEVELPQYETQTTKYQTVHDTTQPGDEAKTYRIEEKIETKNIPIEGSKTTVAQINMGKDNAGQAPKIYKTAGKGVIDSSVTSSGKSSGKGPTRSRPTKKSETVERYKEINDELKQLEHTITSTSQEMDRLWGKSKVDAMKKYGKQLEQEIELQKRFKQQVVENFKTDKLELINFMKEMPTSDGLGGFGDLQLEFKFDEGFITNYEEILTILHNKLNELEAQKNSMTSEEEQSEFDENILSPFQDKISYLQTLLENYDESYADFLEKEEEIRDKELEKMQHNYETITYEIEYKIEMADMDIERLDFYMSLIEDQDFNAVEKMAYAAEKIGPIFENLITYQDELNQLQAAFYNTKISMENFKDGLVEIQSKYIENFETLKQLQQEVGEYYLDTLDEGNEKFDIHTEKLDRLTTKLEHFKEVNTLLYGEQSYTEMKKILDAEEELTLNSMKSAQSKLTMLNSQREQVLKALQEEQSKALSEQDNLLIQQLEENLNEVETMIADEESVIMEAIIKMGEIALEKLNSTLGEAKQKLQESLFGDKNITIDSMMSQIERLSAKQEEYLTNTNKLYETNKLIRQAQIDMDKTDNKRAKQHYDDYIKYIEQLQQSGQLSQFELELAQAEYDILQKKIALEEAQEAKNQVRLTRDAEGNYGYVYTANQENIDKAQQEFEDAQNARYNIALEGAQKYQDQYYQAISDMQDALEELEEQRSSKLITEEEYEKRKVEITETYLAIAQTAHDLYYKATGVMMNESANKRLDYTLKGVGDMETLKNATEVYLEETKTAFDLYDQKIEDVSVHNEQNFGAIDTAMSEVVEESGILYDETNNLATLMNTTLASTLTNSITLWKELGSVINTVGEQSKEVLGKIDREMEVVASNNYAQLIADEYAAYGDNADMEYIENLAKLRDQKLNNLDISDYTQLMADYLAADPNNHTENDPLYKTYQYLRKHKLEQWDKLNFSEMYDLYIKGGGDPDSETAQNILTARSQKINTLGITGEMTNEELVQKTAEKYAPKPENIEDDTLVPGDNGEGGSGNGDNGGGFDIVKGADPITILEAMTRVGMTNDKLLVDNAKILDNALKNMKNAKNDPEKVQALYDQAEAALKSFDTIQNPAYRNSITSGVVGKLLRSTWSDIVDLYYDKRVEYQNSFIPGERVKVPEPGEVTVIDTSIEPNNFNAYKKDGVSGHMTSIAGTYTADDFTILKIGYDNNEKKFYGVKATNNAFNDNVLFYIAAEDVVGINLTDSDYPLSEAPTEETKNRRKNIANFSNSKKYDTGGYTGEWGPEGKIAILHEKELVLNKHDTENFLSATTMLREISQMLDNNALIASLGAINLSAMTLNSPADQVLQQEVTIHADFPNVIDHNEIEIAIDNLINAASQHAYRM